MFAKVKEDTQKGEWCYAGEMEQKHGKEEFDQFKSMGNLKPKKTTTASPSTGRSVRLKSSAKSCQTRPLWRSNGEIT